MTLDTDNIDLFRAFFRTSGDWYTGEDEDPYSMIFVVHDRSLIDPAARPSEKDAVAAAAKAMISLLSRFAEDGVRDRVEAWCGARIRKIVKRAHGVKWDKAAAQETDLPREIAQVGSAKAVCFAPMRVSEQPAEIRKLQVSGLQLVDDQDRDQDLSSPPHLEVVLEAALEMSGGKAVAQAAHAVQLAFRYLDDDDYAAWKESGFVVETARGDVGGVVAARACPVVVRDAGFTEIPAGSTTAAAWLSR